MAKMTVDQLIDRVLFKISDDDFVAADVLSAMDQCLVDIATILDIKQLATVSAVTALANQNAINLPDDYCKKLVYAYNKTTNNPIKVLSSRNTIDKNIGIRVTGGNVKYIAEEGSELYYQYKPSANQLLDVYYHRLPDDLEIGGEFPAWIPGNFVYKLFYNYSVNQLWDIKEEGIVGQGIEQSKINTLFHQSEYNKALESFRVFIGPDPGHPYVPDSNVDFNFDII